MTPQQALQSYFGYSDFRSVQRQIIDRVLEGGHSLVIMPTGGGKSMCFQIPALCIADEPARSDSPKPLTLVLSPLIALMKDQVDALKARNISATFINSSLDKADRLDRYRRLANGEFVIIYVTPERFRKQEFLSALATREVRLLAIDEAHCISQWGHDFRPDYTRIRELRALIGNPTTIALTATATHEVQIDIAAQIGLPGIGDQLDECRLFHQGIGRPNLQLSVCEVWGMDEKIDEIRKTLERWQGSSAPTVRANSGIVYFTLIRTLEEASERLHKLGIEHVQYHGDLARNQRRRIQDAFMSNRSPVVLATNAFGMGIDKEDIRFVVHAEVPGSMESYYQEIGRAGRDGLPSECRLLYDQRDLQTQIEFLRWSNPDADFYQRTYDLLAHDSDSVRSFGIDWLREKLCDRQRTDRRLETVLGMLQRYGVIEDEVDLTNVTVTGPLPAELADPDSRAAKLLRDQRKLYALVEYSKATDSKEFIEAYFAPKLATT